MPGIFHLLTPVLACLCLGRWMGVCWHACICPLVLSWSQMTIHPSVKWNHPGVRFFYLVLSILSRALSDCFAREWFVYLLLDRVRVRLSALVCVVRYESLVIVIAVVLVIVVLCLFGGANGLYVRKKNNCSIEWTFEGQSAISLARARARTLPRTRHTWVFLCIRRETNQNILLADSINTNRNGLSWIQLD